MATTTENEKRRKALRPHPVRDQILDVMRTYDKPLSPTQLARITGSTRRSVAYHVQTLVSAGVVELVDVEHFYQLVPGDEEELPITDTTTLLLTICGALTVPNPDGGEDPVRTVLDEFGREDLRIKIELIERTVRAIAADSTARHRANQASAASPRKATTSNGGRRKSKQP
jgi:biotin operon repressor